MVLGQAQFLGFACAHLVEVEVEFMRGNHAERRFLAVEYAHMSMSTACRSRLWQCL
jgi:hypothetical protein